MPEGDDVAAAPGGAPALSLPKGGGAIRGLGEQLSPNPATGAAGFSVPVAAPSGRGGFGPQLSLAYDSSFGNGPFGFGWRLSPPSIARRSDRGVPTYAPGEDTFLLSGADELVRSQAAATERLGYRVERFRPRVERDLTRVERWTRLADGDVHWRTLSAGNVLTVYGWDAESRIADPDPANAGRVFSWLPCHSYDDRGNAIHYTYAAEDEANVTGPAEQGRVHGANRYLKRIRFGNRGPLLIDPAQPSFRRPQVPAPDFDAAGWMFEVVLDYGEGHYAEDAVDAEGRVLARASAEAPPHPGWPARSDSFSSYRAGFEVRTHRLCRRILVFHRFPEELGRPDYLTRCTELVYAEKPSGSFVERIVQSGFRERQDGRYLKRSLPPLELRYSESPLENPDYEGGEVRDVGSNGEGGEPNLGNPSHQWVDLDGEGIAGLLSQQGGGWHYEPNLGEGQLGAPRALVAQPSQGDPSDFVPLDLAGDGVLDMVTLAAPAPGFSARREDGGFEPFRPFTRAPGLDWRDPGVRLVDLVGDGLADLLAGDGEGLSWHPGLGEEGFAAARRVELPAADEREPRVLLADASQAFFLADMGGDGLTDLVRIRSGEVCYWPSLGHGRFGAKVTMDGAPALDGADRFDPRRLHLVDSDGSGPADIVYAAADAVRVYLNRSGNAWSEPRVLRRVPGADGGVAVSAGDLLGRGTACLIWSSALPGEERRPLRYLDLTEGTKPYLLVEVRNGLGAVTRIEYAPSTKFQLADKAAGEPWATRLPFPVQVAERIETLDLVGRNRYVTRFSYHHGHFDGEAREFRGFGRVERLDTEELAALSASGDIPAAENLDAASHVPPVLTKSWFHTGASGSLRGEYAGEELAATVRSDDLTAAEAARALSGRVLRTEVYGLDGNSASGQPYSVREQGYAVAQLEPGVLQAREREAIEIEYDRGRPEDPLVRHRLTLEHDELGNVLLSAAVAYGRNEDALDDPLLSDDDRALQRTSHIVFTETDFTAPVSREDAERGPLEAERRSFELRNAVPAAGRFTVDELRALVAAASDGLHELPYEDFESGAIGAAPSRRLVERVRTIYRADNLSGPLPLGQAGALALPHRSYRLALTPSLVESVYVTGGGLSPAAATAALSEAGYVQLDGEDGWWAPSSSVAYSSDGGDAAAELAAALAGFFVPRRFLDPYGTPTRCELDPHDLLPVASVDPLGNRTASENDYRVLAPALITDPNGNRSAAAYDALGELAGTALMGKQGETVGDTLEGFEPDLPGDLVATQLADPAANPRAVLGGATTRRIAVPTAQPPVVHTLARETHRADSGPADDTAVQLQLSYSDGFGHEIQVKRFEGAGRWLTSGWTILDNKGAPVRQYEPFRDDTPAFRFANAVGVSSIQLRDPLGQVVAIAHPHKAWEKAAVGPWRSERWDVNDTVLADPAADPDVGGYFSRLPDDAYLPTWHAQRAGGGLGGDEQAAALSTELHAGTPTIGFHDALGRRFLSVEHNRTKRSADAAAEPPLETLHRSLVIFDVEGNERRLVDAAGRVCARRTYDMLGNRIAVATMENGERRLLLDLDGTPSRGWDSRGHEFATDYDELRRPLARRVRGTDPQRSDPRTLAGEVTYERFEYGEGLPGDTASNLRTRLVHAHDGAGLISTDRFDFKGNCLRRSQQLLRDPEELADWSGEPVLEGESFVNDTAYDALDRAVRISAPDGSVTEVDYDRINRLAALKVTLAGAASPTTFVQGVEYDARGERTSIEYGNGARTSYERDPATFRLSRQRTTREAGGNGFAATVFADPTTVQDLRHTYDPIGNLLKVTDDALRTVVSAGQPVTPQLSSEYDALYRLIEAGGREQSSAGDLQSLRRYAERYEYDLAGNLLHLSHRATGGNWQRDYEYAEASQLEPGKTSNRLTRAPLGGEAAAAFGYDEHGCMTRMPQLPSLRWDFCERLGEATLQAGPTPETVLCAYDSAGARVRKIVRRQNGGRRSERIYLPGAEIYREYGADGVTVSLRRDSLQVMDERRPVALVESEPGGVPAVRFQLANQVGSVCLELDQAGAAISYEEFTPFGSTALFGGRSVAETSLKRYRFAGKERDEETGLSYYGARYYAPWLGRWTSCDPLALAGTAGRAPPEPDGEWRSASWNPYVYANDSPGVYSDPTGMLSQKEIATLAALIPTGGLLITAGVLAIYDATQDYGPKDKRWVSLQEGGIFDIWTFGHYLLPATIGLLVTIALDAWAPGLSAEAVYAISGMTAATVAWLYEVIERPLWAGIHKWTGQPSRLNSTTPVLGWADRVAHSASKDAALEWKTNTVGDVVIGTTGAFTFSYLYLLFHGRHGAPDPVFAAGFGAFGLGVAFGASVALVYGGYIETRETHGYDPVLNRFYLLSERSAPNDRLDPRYSPFQPIYA